MKKIFLIIIISSVSFLKIDAQDVSISFQGFYDQLSPYGTWVEYPNEGYVWSPNVGADFRPYGSRGHWVYTDEGWTWVSGYAWGWAPFHYGRWIYDDDRGWLWVPGYEWAPAWVTWGSYNGCYGWAPLGIDFTADYVGYRPPSTWWLFVGGAYITSSNWHSHVYGGWSSRPRTTIINNTTIVNNNVTVINNIQTNRGGRGGEWMRGPQPTDVQRYTHSTIRPVAITVSGRPGATSVSGNHLTIYRPVVNRAAANNLKPARAESFDRFRPATRPASTNNNPPPNTRKPNSNLDAARRPVRTPQPNNPPVNRSVNPDRSRPDNNNRPLQPKQVQRPQPQKPSPNVVRPKPTTGNRIPPQHNAQPLHQQRPPAPRPVNPQPRPVQHNPPPPPSERKHGR